MQVIHAVYANGVFKPTEHVELPEFTEVEFEVRVVQPGSVFDQSGIYRILSRRYESGEHDVAARHEEHQP